MELRGDPIAERHESLWMLAASPTIWALHLMLSYATAALWCGMVAGPYGSLYPVRITIGIYTAVALVGVGAFGIIGYRRHLFQREAPPHDADTPEDRHRFIGFATLLLSGMSAVAVVYAALAAVFIEGCQ